MRMAGLPNQEGMSNIAQLIHCWAEKPGDLRSLNASRRWVFEKASPNNFLL
jgi:hypothetical protein